MKIRLHQQILGENIGAVVDVSEADGERYIRDGYAGRVSTVTDRDEEIALGFDGGKEESPSEAEAAPAKSANKGEWVDYAVARGANREEAEARTKADIVEEYGAHS